MSFEGKRIVSTMDLFSLTVEGDMFISQESLPSQSTYSLAAEFIDINLLYPPSNLPQAREMFISLYVPYSVETFTKKVKEVYTGFAEAVTMTDELRGFTRRMWLFKRLYDLFDGSFGLIKTRMTSLIPNIYAKAIKVLQDADTKVNVYKDTRSERYANIAIRSIRIVYQKVVEAVAREPKFLKLLSPPLLGQFVKDASPYMVSNIRRLRWIEPETALLATPNHVYFWQDFWSKIFIRNFNKKNFRLSDEVCHLIAEFMPMDIRGEAFMDFIRRFFHKNNTYKSRCIGDNSFRVERSHTSRNGQLVSTVKLILSV